MDDIILIVVFCLLFHPSIFNGQAVELSFNTSMYDGTDDYYAHISEDVILTCTVPSTETRVYMYKGRLRQDYEILVEDGELVIERNGKYSFVPFDGEYQLTIHNLDKSDSLNYWCRGCRYTDRCLGTDRRCCRWRKVYLDVKETSDDTQTPDYCGLVSNTDGIFFTGNNLILRCPKELKDDFELKAFKGNSRDKVIFNITNEGTGFNRLTTESLAEKVNGTRLSCLNVKKSNGKDYCRNLPSITVFNELTIKLSHGKHGITNGKKVIFTCYSYPFLPFTIEWDIQQRDVIFGNVSVSEISQGSRIAINNVEFLNSTSSSLMVICNVTIGSENSFEMASVYLPMKDGATFISPVSIVVPITVVIILFGIIVLVLVYFRAKKPVASKEVHRQNDNINQGVGNAEENVYHTRNNEKTELGLTNHDSEVVD